MMIDAAFKPQTKQKRRGRFTLADAESMAFLVGQRKLTEHEAALKLNFKPDSWYSWKSRSQHQSKFASIVARVRGDAINNAMERIEKAGERDWRADHARLQLIAPERFARDRNDGVTVNQNSIVSLVGGPEQLRKMIDSICKPQAKPDVRSLPPAT